MSETTSVPLQVWERAEVERSDIEASLTSRESLAIGPKKRRRYQNPSAGTPYPLEYAYHLLGDVDGRAVLDIGCGSGMNSVLVAFKGAHVAGIDISPSLLRLADERARLNGVGARTRFLATSAHELPFGDESFDVVFGIAILHHLDLAPVANEVRRVLKPGGRAIFQEPVRNSALLRRVRALIPYQAPDVSPFEAPLTDGQITRFADGFELRRIRAFSLPHVNLAQVLPVVRDHQHKIHVIDGALLRHVPALAHLAGQRVWEMVKVC